MAVLAVMEVPPLHARRAHLDSRKKLCCLSRAPVDEAHNRAAVFGAKRGAIGLLAPVPASGGWLLAFPHESGLTCRHCFQGKPVGSSGSGEGLPQVARIAVGKMGLTDA